MVTEAEAILRGFGDELSDLAGFWTTRLTALVSPDTQFQTASLGSNYAGSPAVIITLTSGTFSASVVPGQKFRILSGTYAGAEGTILTRDSDTQITLTAALALNGTPIVAPISNAAWEIITPADTTLNVESTLKFSDSGRIVLDGRVYFYSSKTVTTFDGLTYDDGTGTITNGVAVTHRPLAEVADFSRTVSALDTYRRSFLVNYATGSDLDIVGTNIGVERPPALTNDDTYRALIKAVAYAPRGTIYAMEQALDVLIGPGLYTIFEDLTSASPLQKPCTVYFTVLGKTTRFVGKTFLDGGEEGVLLDSTTEFTLPDDNHIKVHGLRPYPEGGVRLIDGSDTLTIASADSGVTITGGSGTFSTRIQTGDTIQIKDGALEGTKGIVSSRDSDTQLTLGIVEGVSNESPTDDGTIGQNFSGARWVVTRDKTNVRYYRPSAEAINEGGQIVSPWEYVGGGIETTTVTPNHTGGANYNALLLNTNTNIVAYRKRLRVRPEDTVLVEMNFDVDATQPSGSSPEQNGFLFFDGNRCIAFGTQGDASLAHINGGMFDVTTGNFLTGASGDFIWGASNTVFIPGFNTVVVEKVGTKFVRLWRKNDAGGAPFNANNTPLQFIAEFAYTAFPLAAASIAALSYTTPTNKDLVFGTMISALSIQTLWRHIDFRVIPHDEFGSQTEAITEGGSVATNQLNTTNTFAVGTFPASGTDIGRRVTVMDSQAANASGGNALGEWEVSAQPANNLLTVTGPTERRGFFTFENRSWLVVRDNPEAFIWPRHMGHSVEILSGNSTGVYPIVGVVDPVTRRRYEDPALGTSPSGANTMKISSTDASDATLAIGSGDNGPTVEVVGLVSGVETRVTLSIVQNGTTLVPTNFDSGSVLHMQLLSTTISGRKSRIDFNGDILLQNASTNEIILRITGGDTGAGKAAHTSLKTVDGAFFDSTAALLPGTVNTIASPPTEQRSSIVLLDTTGLTNGFEVEAGEVTWRLVPNFPAGDATLSVDDIILETAVADTYARRDTKVFPGGYGADASNLELMEVYRTKVLSGQMHAPRYRNDVNDFDTQDYDLYPFYLPDEFGDARSVLDDLTAAGVIPDFDCLFVDAQGSHLQE